MRVSSRFQILFFVLLLGLCGAQSARADIYGGAWAPKDGNVNALKFTPTNCKNLIELYMYKWGEEKDISTDLKLMQIVPSPTFVAADVTISKGSGNQWAAIMGDQTLVLGSTNVFGLYFLDYGDGKVPPYITDPVIFSESNTWFVQDPDNCATVAVVDATPVPLPAAAWILGSGLLGIAGLRKRFKP
jgi:hypothetical protein